MHPVTRTLFAALVSVALLAAQGQDLVVDSTGAGGAFTEIGHAMLAADPGDRILVMPGSYPTFQFSRGVHVIGMGAIPEDVTIQRIAYHVSIPSTDYETVLSNVRVRGNSFLDVFAISGNELAPGTLTIDGCVLEGGVYLRGGQAGFYLHVNNSRIVPPAGYGFSGEAARLGGPGNYVELRNTKVIGWDADPIAFAPAGDAVRFDGGTRARITGSQLLAGSGTATGLYAPGGTAISTISSGVVEVGIEGGSMLRGGDAFGSAPGGHGTNVAGTIHVGSATVLGGGGSPSGLPHAGSATVVGTGTLALDTDPAWSFAEEGIALAPGQTFEVNVPSGAGVPLLGVAFRVLLPGGPEFVSLPLEAATVFQTEGLTATVPTLPGTALSGLMVYFQGARVDVTTSDVVISDTVAYRIDL